jgi:hypothetical protein
VCFFFIETRFPRNNLAFAENGLGCVKRFEKNEGGKRSLPGLEELNRVLLVFCCKGESERNFIFVILYNFQGFIIERIT